MCEWAGLREPNQKREPKTENTTNPLTLEVCSFYPHCPGPLQSRALNQQVSIVSEEMIDNDGALRSGQV